MAIDRTYWQGMKPTEPWSRCSPNLGVILRYLMALGGASLGCYARRPIRGGTSWSSHAFGAAVDYRYANAGGGRVDIDRATFEAVVLPWLVEHADLLGIQQIHDYYGARIWRTGRGWRTSTAEHMGARWALYVHLETNAASWANLTPLPMRGVPVLDLEPGPVNPIPTLPTNESEPMTTIHFDHVMLSTSTPSTGQDGEFVKMWQAILNARWRFGADPIPVDGRYGIVTALAVEGAQRFARITVDGLLGPQTARVLLDR